jgi:hypothetical protein
VTAYLNQMIAQRDLPRCSLYYPSAFHLLYLIARAYAAGATALAPSVPLMQKWLTSAQQADGSWGDDLENACAVSTLLHLDSRGAAVDRGVAAIMSRQQANGSWRRTRFIENYHGSEALTTAISLEALARYRRLRGEEVP